LDFSGATSRIVVDYDYVVDAAGKPTKTAKILAMEARNFLGKVFLCASAGDYLAPEMYTSAKEILEWIDARPMSQADCGLIARYTGSNISPDSIPSLVNGVPLTISPGPSYDGTQNPTGQSRGFGRVVGVVLFEP